ncbi:alpha/beta hydrolase [Nonomuraea sp. NPDC003709]|uniref:alpha/beta hydrolase n=1 Tax=Nonomuraea sp. NPDC003709 TaxID=3154450 RepID=UPI0033AE6885
MLRNLLLAGLVTVGALVVWPGQPGGRLVRVYGDLATADRVAVIVPGADTTVATFDDGTKRPGGAARALLAEAARLAPHERLAVVAWLGYDSPPTLSLGVLTSDAAVKGAHALRRTITELHTRTPAPIALLCHSYGSVLCAKAVPGLPVTDLAVFGSPGLDTPSATALTQPAHTAETTRATALTQPAHTAETTRATALTQPAHTAETIRAAALTPPVRAAETARAAASAPTADTTRGMTGGHDAQGATGGSSQDTRGTTGAQDDQDAADSYNVQRATGSVGAQDPKGAQEAGSPDTTGTPSPPDTGDTADLPDAWSTAGVPGARGDAKGAAMVPLRVWAGLGENDWVRFVPKVKLGPVGFGADPMNPSFGARVFAVGSGGHSDYFTPGTPSLRNLTLIALGHEGEVTS